ncbi:hypothetical protein BDQ17DRAFT_1362044, partial [Cyathus striatus]
MQFGRCKATKQNNEVTTLMIYNNKRLTKNPMRPNQEIPQQLAIVHRIGSELSF